MIDNFIGIFYYWMVILQFVSFNHRGKTIYELNRLGCTGDIPMRKRGLYDTLHDAGRLQDVLTDVHKICVDKF